jgi:ATP-dependent DNA ligase
VTRWAWPRSSSFGIGGTSRRLSFDLLELNGSDLRREPIEVRKATLASILRKSRPGVRLNEHLEHSEGAVVFQHACKMGLDATLTIGR